MLGLALLLPSFASAQPIRVLLVMPSGSAKLERQVARLERALREPRASVVQARSLAEADVVVQFTAFRHTIDDKGVASNFWEGELQVLSPSARDAGLARDGAKPFAFLVVGRETWEMEPAVALLARTLADALGRGRRPRTQTPL